MDKKPGRKGQPFSVELVVLLLAPVLVFLQVTGHEFLGYDDPLNIFQNPRVTTFSLANLGHFWRAPAFGLYIPVTYTLWLLLAQLSQFLGLGDGSALSPLLFHLANFLVHLGGTLLVFLILRALLAHTRAALAGALLFAIHPVQVEPVAWASGMKDLLSGFWSLLALWLYLGYCQSPAGPRRLGRYLGASLALLLALLAKPAAVTVPLLAGLVGWLLLERPWRQVVRELAPWLLAAAAVALVTGLAQPASGHVFQPAFWQRFLVAGDAVSFYLGKLLLPLNLGPDYGRLPELVLARGWVYLTGLLPYLLAALLCWRAPRAWRVGAGLFLIPLLPVLGLRSFAFQEVSTVADRYLYLAMLGPAWAVALLWQRYQHLRLGRLAIALGLAGLAGQSTLQTSHWRNSEVFSQQALRVNPRSWNSHLRYGIAQYLAGHREAAVAAFTQALAIKPDFVDAHYSLGVVYWEGGEAEQALSAFKRAMAIDPAHAPTALGLGDLYRQSDRCQLAVQYYQIAVASELARAEYHVSLGECYARLGREEEARASFRQALALEPDDPEARARLAALGLSGGR